MMMVVPINTNNHYHHQNIRMMMITMLVMTFGTTLYHHRLGPIFFFAPQGTAPRCLVGLKLTPAPCADNRVLPMEKVRVDSAGRRYWWD